MSLFISDAVAAATGSVSQQGSPWGSMIMLAGLMLVFYFLLWRPQSKRAKEHRDLVGGLSKGDEVITSGGILGTVTQVDDSFIKLQIADNIEVRVQKSAVTMAVPKGTVQTS